MTLFFPLNEANLIRLERQFFFHSDGNLTLAILLNFRIFCRVYYLLSLRVIWGGFWWTYCLFLCLCVPLDASVVENCASIDARLTGLALSIRLDSVCSGSDLAWQVGIITGIRLHGLVSRRFKTIFGKSSCLHLLKIFVPIVLIARLMIVLLIFLRFLGFTWMI